jgi:hypothetical protein
MTITKTARPLMMAVAGLMLSATACAPLEDIIVPPGQNSMVEGEVRSLDTRRGRMDIRDDRYGRNRTVRIDDRTRVLDGSRQQPVSTLRRGDYVRVRLSYDRSGQAWADRVELRHGSNDRRNTARVERLDGRVAGVDHRRGHFALEQGRRNTVVVHVPRGISSGDARRFDRLRRGDRVRVEVRHLGRDQAQLVRFR